MEGKTKLGRHKGYECPYCRMPCYSVYSLNVHIAARHAGKPTIDPNKRDKMPKIAQESQETPKKLIPFNQLPQEEEEGEEMKSRKKSQDQDEEKEEEQDEDDDDPYK